MTDQPRTETFDHKVWRALTLLHLAETAAATGETLEFEGVTITPKTVKPSDPLVSITGGILEFQGVTIAPGPKTQHTVTQKTPFGVAHVTTERPTRLYTAGCISGDDRPFEEKASVFYEGAASLRGEGFEVVNPLDIGNDRCFHGEDACRENTMRRLKGADQGAGHSWECYLRHDLVEVLQCDGVALLPGWQDSPGARMEFDVASRVGIPCKPIEDWLNSRIGGAHAFRVDTNGHDYCARCGITRGEHRPGGSRAGCSYAGPGHEGVCRLCVRGIIWDGITWRDAEATQNHICPGSARPDAAHEPDETGEQR